MDSVDCELFLFFFEDARTGEGRDSAEMIGKAPCVESKALEGAKIGRMGVRRLVEEQGDDRIGWR